MALLGKTGKQKKLKGICLTTERPADLNILSDLPDAPFSRPLGGSRNTPQPFIQRSLFHRD
jgi:hypothetical protein